MNDIRPANGSELFFHSGLRSPQGARVPEAALGGYGAIIYVCMGKAIGSDRNSKKIFRQNSLLPPSAFLNSLRHLWLTQTGA